MPWGIKYALASSVREHGEHADDAAIWVNIDYEFETEQEAQLTCDDRDAESDGQYVHRPVELK